MNWYQKLVDTEKICKFRVSVHSSSFYHKFLIILYNSKYLHFSIIKSLLWKKKKRSKLSESEEKKRKTKEKGKRKRWRGGKVGEKSVLHIRGDVSHYIEQELRVVFYPSLFFINPLFRLSHLKRGKENKRKWAGCSKQNVEDYTHYVHIIQARKALF